MRIQANYSGYTTVGSLDFEATLIDMCASATISIVPTILSSLTIHYGVSYAPHSETLDLAKVLASPAPLTACPNKVLTIDDGSGGPINSSAFTFDALTNELTVFTLDSSLAGVYNMRILGRFDGLAAIGELHFKVIIGMGCSHTTVQPSTIEDQTFLITDSNKVVTVDY